MFKMSKIFCSGAVSVGVCMMVCAAVAATGRANYDNVRASTVGATTAARMPSMPALSVGIVGNISTNVPDNGGVPEPVKPNPEPEPEPEPEPVPECPDGGVKNSSYGVENCMTDVLNCVNNGALPNGLNDMFNEDLRNAIVNGMGLCAVHIDKCVSDVRRDCKNVYRSAADVWIDFNSRRVQPEYYSFVLRKTGLTPNQAENTCRLLDKNTFGPSFAAVANDGKTTAEYNQQVGAYNSQQGNVLVKTNPQGVRVNDGNPGVDGQRGHYARWDATTATCLIRVAAYNKDNQITNSWLFGALGDERPAEVWQPAGETFSCNKDLFGFSLMKDTSTVAAVGVGGGTLVGAGVGAVAGHGKREFDCTRDSHLKQLTEGLNQGHKIGVLNQYLEEGHKLSTTGGQITTAQCEDILNLYNVYAEYDVAVAECEGMEYYTEEVSIKIKVTVRDGMALDVPVKNGVADDEEVKRLLVQQGIDDSQIAAAAEEVRNQVAEKLAAASEGKCKFKPLNLAKMSGTGIYCSSQSGCLEPQDVRRDIDTLRDIFANVSILDGEKSNMGKSVGIGAAIGAGTGGLATAITAFVERNNINCRVGDGLAQVGFNKAYSIGNLKDFYVKWNLRLPDVIAPTATINDCVSWRNTCATFTDLEQCKAAQFNYKPAGAATTSLVHGACSVSGSACIENHAVAKSFGACE